MNHLDINDHEQIARYIQTNAQNLKLDDLGYLLVQTKSNEVRDIIALHLADYGNETSVTFIIQALQDPETFNYRSTLVYACYELCERYGCAKHIEFFIDLVIHDTYHSSLEALTIVDLMKASMSPEQKASARIKIGEISEEKYGNKVALLKRLLKYVKD